MKEDESDSENDDGATDDGDEVRIASFRHFPCMPHTLQLVVHVATKSTQFQPLIAKVRSLVSRIRKSSKASEKLVSLTGKTVVLDCITRWNSTLMMLERLKEVRDHLNRVLDDQGWDGLANTEWQRIDHLIELLKPFAEHTDLLQADNSTMSSALFAILDLQYFLEDGAPTGCHSVANAMKISLVQRTSRYLQPSHERFEPLPAVAALLDPASASQLISLTDREDLVESARAFIKVMSQRQPEVALPVSTSNTQEENAENQPEEEADDPPVKRLKFKYLAQKVGNLPVPGPRRPRTIDNEFDEYITTVRQGVASMDSSFGFWQAKATEWPILAPFALDVVSLPASQASAERVFSVCGDFTRGKRNRTKKTLERAVFLRSNGKKFPI